MKQIIESNYDINIQRSFSRRSKDCKNKISRGREDFGFAFFSTATLLESTIMCCRIFYLLSELSA